MFCTPNTKAQCDVFFRAKKFNKCRITLHMFNIIYVDEK